MFSYKIYFIIFWRITFFILLKKIVLIVISKIANRREVRRLPFYFRIYVK